MAETKFGFQIGSSLATQYLTDSKYIRASYMVVDTIAIRDSLPVDTGSGGVIVKGSLVYVTSESKTYRYDGSAWIEEKGGDDCVLVVSDGLICCSWTEEETTESEAN